MKSLKELHQEFMDEKQYSERLRPSTLKGYAESFKLLNKLIPGLSVEDLTRETMNRFFKQLETRKRIVGKGREVNGVRASTTLTYWSKLNTFFEWVVSQKDNKGKPKYIRVNPLLGIRRPQVKYDDRRWLNHQELEKIMTATILNAHWLNNYVRKRNIAIILTLLFTGIRSGELVGLYVSDIDFERRLLTIRGETSKSREHRKVPINPKLWTHLNDYLDARKKENKMTPYLFTSSTKDEGFTADGLKSVVKHIVKASGVKFHPHRFRHTFAVNLSLRNIDVYHLKVLMGHQNIDMTTKYLRHFPQTKMREDINTLSLENMA